MKRTLLLLLFWVGYFCVFWFRAFGYTAQGDFYTTHSILWADWAAHFTMGSAMAYRELIPQTSPFLVYAPFAYPFAVNLLSAILIRCGVSFFTAFIVPSFIFSVALVMTLFGFYLLLFRRKSIAAVALCIFLLNGGTGALNFIGEVIHSEQPISVIQHPPEKYTNNESQGIYWMSVIDSVIIPQRSFAPGMTVGLLCLMVIYSTLFVEKVKYRSVALICSVVGLGFLPLIHTHSFLAVGMIGTMWVSGELFFLVSKQPLQLTKVRNFFVRWLLYGIGVLAISLPIIKYFIFTQVSHQFITSQLGWYGGDVVGEWLVFWWKNWGLTLPAAGIGYLFWLKEKKFLHPSQKAFLFLPFALLFLCINIFNFQPFLWDNTKLLTWVSVGISGLAGYAVVYLWQKNFILKIVSVSLFIAIIASGAIDAYRILEQQQFQHYVMYTHEESALASWVKNNTDKSATWLTSDKHNHWLYNLTGRQTVMAYRGWLWSQGYLYSDVEKDVTALFSDFSRQDLLEKYHIEYIVIGPDEQTQWHADPTQAARYFTLMFQTPHYQIFQYNHALPQKR